MDWFKLEILSIIAIAGITQGIFLSSALLKTKRGEHLVNRILVCIIALFSLDILFSTISFTLFLRIDHCIRFLYGPALFFYIRILNSHSFHIKRKDILHFLPFFISFLFILPFTFLSSRVRTGDFIFSTYLNLEDFMYIMKIFFSLSVFIHLSSYLIYCYRKMMWQGDNGAILNKKEFRLLRILIVICFFYNVLCLISSATRIFKSDPVISAYFPPLSITFILYFLGYISILKPGFLFIVWEKENNHSVYKKVHLSEQKSKEYLKKLLSVMEKEKLYTDPDLTLPMLADRVNISRNLLSYLLNSVLGINFYDFVNGFRIEAVKKLLTDTSLENESILNIAFHAGFNSKSAFNKIFKKHTNMSPSQYKKISLNKTKETKIFSHILELNLLENAGNGYGIKSIHSI